MLVCGVGVGVAVGCGACGVVGVVGVFLFFYLQKHLRHYLKTKYNYKFLVRKKLSRKN